MTREQLVITDDLLGGNVGQVLFAGKLTATLRSKLSGEHITLRLVCKAKVAGRWRTVPYHLASHVFIDVPNSGDFADRVATLYPPHSPARWAGWFYPDNSADSARVWAAKKVLAIATGQAPVETDQYELDLATNCLRCGRELTEPESIEAGMGPHCRATVSQEYGTRHQAKRKAQAERIVAQGPARPLEDGADVHPQLPIVIEPGTPLADLVEQWERS